MSWVAGAAYSTLLALTQVFLVGSISNGLLHCDRLSTPIISILIYNSIIMAFMIAGATISWLHADLDRSLKLLTVRELAQSSHGKLS